MAEEQGLNIFGFEIRRKKQKEEDKKLPSIVPATDDDGAGYVTASGMHYGQFINLDGDESKDNAQLIMKYRGVSAHPEVDAAIEDIANESISASEGESAIEIRLDKVEVSDQIKKGITEEFENIVSMLNFNEIGHDMFKRWYVDGRLYHHLVVNEANLKAGIQEIRPIDASKVRKIKQVKKKKDPKTGALIVEKTDEYYLYQEKPGSTSSGIKLSNDSVSYVTSGLLDASRKKIVSHLHKALKPINQLRMMEDSLVIYRLARAPERRIFYIDVGNLPRGKSEQYMKDIMARYRNKLVYDADTGAVKDDRKHMSMLEDFWLPRREGGRGTEISTLPGGENLGQIDDIVYFQKKLYKSLNVPIGRLESEGQFSLGRATEISRDELKFQKFIDRLRKRFAHLFTGILKTQLIMKGLITEEDWDSWKNDIFIDYSRDNHFTELKDAELLRDRLTTLDQASQYVGEYFSKEYIMKKILMLSDEDIKDIAKQSAEEPDPEPADNKEKTPEVKQG
jgi:hypothetical protein|tara:strand:- start:86 stop:1609 length:1524 start_codon:yes stop_codon:yes gene_type:complete